MPAGGRGSRFKTPRAKQGRMIAPPPVAAPDSNRQVPHFSFEYMQSDGYSVDDCSHDDRAALATALWKRSRMTWAEIYSSGRHGLGSEVISRESIRGTPPRGITPDVDFMALRFSGMKPMVGFRTGRTFHIIWLDHNFSLYDHGA